MQKILRVRFSYEYCTSSKRFSAYCRNREMDPLQGEYNVNDLVAPPTGGEGSEEESAKFWTEFIHGVSVHETRGRQKFENMVLGFSSLFLAEQKLGGCPRSVRINVHVVHSYNRNGPHLAAVFVVVTGIKKYNHVFFGRCKEDPHAYSLRMPRKQSYPIRASGYFPSPWRHAEPSCRHVGCA